MDEKWLVAVTAGRWQRHGISEARRAGLRVIAIDADKNAEGFAEADISLTLDLSDYDGVIKELRKLDKPLAGAISFCSEAGMLLAAHIREEFSLPGAGISLSRRLIDKALQRKQWSLDSVPGPQWLTANSIEGALRAIHDIGFPCIIKPTDSSGSRGVTKIELSSDDLSQAVNRAFEFAKSHEVIVESFMTGTEFTVEVFGVAGEFHVLAVTEKKKVAGTRGTVASELATPDRPDETVARLAEAVVMAFKSLGYVDGPGHAEAILKDDGTVGIVEVAGRGGGFAVFDKLVPTASGVNIAKLAALGAVASAIDPIKVKKQACILRFFPSQIGELVSIDGFSEANDVVGVEATCFVKVGDRFGRAQADGDRLGYILSHASTPCEARARADHAESLIRFRFVSQ